MKTLTFPNFWVESANKTRARRDQVLEVGGAPSESDKAVKLLLRAAAGQFKHAIECTNYVILQLKTKENVADAISRGDLILQELDGGDTCYVVSSWFSLFEEMPFQNKSKWTLTIELLACRVVYRDDGSCCSGVPTCRRCTLLPHIDASSWTLLHRKFMIEFSLRPFTVTYYVAVRLPEKGDGEGIDLCIQDTQPLLACLARNYFTAARHHNPFVLEVHPDPVFPICSCSTTAMSVGFFAYKSEHLALLGLSAPQLLQKISPIEHPLGSFWLLPAVAAWDKMRLGDMIVRQAACHLTQTTTQDAVPMSNLIQEAQAVHLQSRKRKLEDHIEELKLELGVNQQNLTKVQRQLASLAESQSS